MLQGMRPPTFVVFNSDICSFSARPSKLRARLAIAAIWCIACALAAPMAVALGVTDIEDTDPSKFWYRWRNLISSCSKTYFFYEGLIVPVSTLPSELFSVGISASVSRTEISIEPLFLFTLLAVR